MPGNQRLSENLIHLAPRLLAARWFQVPRGAFHVGMTKPLRYRAQIDTSPEAFRGERSAELVQPEAIRVELRTFGNGLEAVGGKMIVSVIDSITMSAPRPE